MVRIPEGWFLMGSESGRTTNVRCTAFGSTPSSWPRARSPTRITRQFLDRHATIPNRRIGTIPNFSHPEQPVVAHFVVRRRCLLRLAESNHRAPLSFAHRSGMGARRPRRPRSRNSIPGAMSRPNRSRITPRGGRRPRTGRAAPNEMRTACATSARTSTNGARTGSAPIITPSRPTEIRRGHAKVAPRFSRRLLAALHESLALRRSLQHPTGISVRRLWLPRSPRSIRIISEAGFDLGQPKNGSADYTAGQQSVGM